LGKGDLLDLSHCCFQIVLAPCFKLFQRRTILLAVLLHFQPLRCMRDVVLLSLPLKPSLSWRRLAWQRYYSIVSPIWRAVPSMVLIADCKLVVLRSCNFVLAISSTLAREIVPTFSRLGFPDPFGIPAAFFSRSAAGGVLVSKVNERSA